MSKKDEEKLENNRKEVEKELDRLTGMVQDLKDLTARLNAKRTEKDSLMKQLAKEQKDVENDKLSLQEEQELLASQQSAIQQAIQSEKNRKKRPHKHHSQLAMNIPFSPPAKVRCLKFRLGPLLGRQPG